MFRCAIYSLAPRDLLMCAGIVTRHPTATASHIDLPAPTKVELPSAHHPRESSRRSPTTPRPQSHTVHLTAHHGWRWKGSVCATQSHPSYNQQCASHPAAGQTLKEFFLSQVPQARLVPGRWLVFAAEELEGEHSGHGRCCRWHNRHVLVHQCAEGAADQVP